MCPFPAFLANAFPGPGTVIDAAERLGGWPLQALFALVLLILIAAGWVAFRLGVREIQRLHAAHAEAQAALLRHLTEQSTAAVGVIERNTSVIGAHLGHADRLTALIGKLEKLVLQMSRAEVRRARAENPPAGR